MKKKSTGWKPHALGYCMRCVGTRRGGWLAGNDGCCLAFGCPRCCVCKRRLV